MNNNAGLFRKVKGAVHRHWFALVSALLALLLVGFSVVLVRTYNETLAKVRGQTESLNNVMLNQTRNELDTLIRSISNIVSMVGTNQQVMQMGRVRLPVTSGDHYGIYSLVNSFFTVRNYLGNNRLVKEVAVYYPYSDIFVASSSHYRPQNFYKSVYACLDMDYAEWKETISSYYSGRFLPVYVTDVSSKAETLLYIQSMDAASTPSGNILIFMDLAELQREIQNMELLGNGFVYLSMNGNIIGSGDAPEGVDSTIRERLVSGGDIPAHYIMEELNSNAYKDLKYYVFYEMRFFGLPDKAVQKSYTTTIVIFILLTGLFLGMLLTLLLRPAVRMLRQYRRALAEGNTPENPVETLQQAISALLAQKQDATKDLNGEWPILKEAILNLMTRGRSVVDSAGGGPEVDTVLSRDMFAVALFYFYCMDSQDINMIVSEISGMLSGNGACCRMGGRTLAVIFSFDSEDNEVESQTEALRAEWAKHTGTPVTACLGGAYSGFEGIKLSFNDAVRCFDYRIFTGDDMTIVHGQYQFTDNQYYYPMDMEISLTAAVKSGSFQKVSDILDQIHEENFEKRHLRPEIAQLLLSDLIGTAIKTLESTLPGAASYDYGGSLELILACGTVEELFHTMRQIYMDACERLSGSSGSVSGFKEQMLAYVSEHYTDAGFSQSVMAEDLGLSPNYLSALFKSQFGEKMVTYVNNMRIQKAMELLRDTNKTVSEIALSVGFSCSDALTRSFKKICGVTPGGYRQSVNDV